MEKVINVLDSISGLVVTALGIAVGVIIAIAIIRSVRKLRKGEPIAISPVGVINDLPETVTGIRKEFEINNEEDKDNSNENGQI